MLFRRDDDVSISKPTTTVSEQDASRVIAGITNDWAGGKDRVSLVDTYAALPESIKREAKRQDAENAVKGVFHDGQIHIVLDQHSSTFFVLKTDFGFLLSLSIFTAGI